MIEVATIVGDTGTDVVDASIHGLAARLPGKGTLNLSGPAAEETAVLLGSPLRTVVLGDEVGRASLLKMLIGGVNKGLVALLLELSLVADAEGILDEFWAVCRAAYPGVMEPFERLLPTYPEHAARRVDEIAELERTVSAADRTPVMASAIRTVIQEATGAPVEIRLLVGRLAASQAASAEPRRG